MNILILFHIISSLTLSPNLSKKILQISTINKNMSAAPAKDDGSSHSHPSDIMNRLDKEFWTEEYGNYERKKDLQGPWDSYIGEHSQLRKYLLSNKYCEEKCPEKTSLGHKISNTKAPPLFIVFGSGPEPGHVQGEAENDSDPDMTYWCPDVRAAMPVLSKTLAQESGLGNGTGKKRSDKPSKFKYIYCAVGSKDEWKDPDNSFRLDPYISLKRIPTLFDWATGDKLEEDDCKDAAKIKAFLDKHFNAILPPSH